MSRASLLVVLAVLLLTPACGFRGAMGVGSTPVATTVAEMAASTPTPQAPAAAEPTPSIAARPWEYTDPWLCFRVEVPTGWTADGVQGGFAWFSPATGQSSWFNVSNVHLEETTLDRAFGDVQAGPLATYVQNVEDFAVAGQPALWITFKPGAEFQFLVLVIAPDCGDGPHALFVSATGADQRSFESFLSRVGFISS